MGWNYLSIPELLWLHRPTLYNGCNYLSMQGFKLIHFSKRGLRCLQCVLTKYICYKVVSKHSIWYHYISREFIGEKMSDKSLTFVIGVCFTIIMFFFNSLWPIDAMCHLRSWLTPVHVMAWWHEAITWTNLNLPSRSSSIHSRVMLTRILNVSIPMLCLKCTDLKWQPHLPGHNELTIL